MDILLSSDIFRSFFKNFNRIIKSDLDKHIHDLVQNKNLRFIMTKQLVDIIESNFIGTVYYETIYVPFMTHLITNQSVNVKIDCFNGDLDFYNAIYSKYLELPANRKSDVFLQISHKNVSLKKDFSIEIENIEKPNRHFVGFTLACYNPLPITLRYFDFSDNDQIKEIFNFLFKIQNEASSVAIYDRQVNLDHSLFDSFKNSCYVTYYTKRRKQQIDHLDAVQSIKSKFRRVKLFVSYNENIHERMVIVNSTIVDCDDDFENVDIKRPTWKISIEYNKANVLQLVDKNNLFQEIRI